MPKGGQTRARSLRSPYKIANARAHTHTLPQARARSRLVYVAVVALSCSSVNARVCLFIGELE